MGWYRGNDGLDDGLLNANLVDCDGGASAA
jgi:hypothetical protein